LTEEREILGRISPEKRSRPAQGSEPAAKFFRRRCDVVGVYVVAPVRLLLPPQGALNRG